MERANSRQRRADLPAARIARFVNDDQRLRRHRKPMRRQIAHQPFPILEPRQIGIEAADLGEDGAPCQQGRADAERTAPNQRIERRIHGVGCEAALLAGAIIADDIAADPGRRGIGRGVQRVELARELLRRPFIVAVEQRDPFTLGRRDAGVARRRRTLITLMPQQPDALIAERGDRLRGTVTRSVVHDNDFMGRTSLLPRARDRATDLLATVVERDDDRNRIARSRHRALLL